MSQQSTAQPTPVSALRSGIGGLSVMWQTAGGILIATAVIIAAHELWAYNRWRVDTIRIRDEKAAELIAILKENSDADPKLDMKKGLQSIRSQTPNKYSWFFSDGKSELEMIIPDR